MSLDKTILGQGKEHFLYDENVKYQFETNR